MTLKSALEQVNSAILDLQSAEYDTFVRPLKRLNAVLGSAELKGITDDLKSKVDFDEFLQAANKPTGMVGSASLNWPVEREQELGLTICLIEKGANDPDWFRGFAHEYYYGGGKITHDLRKVTSSVLVPFNRDLKAVATEREPQLPTNIPKAPDFQRVFIVHGHDEAPREAVARFVSQIGLKPVILHEQPNKGQTIPEKLLANANVGFAVVLLTPDDLGRAEGEVELRPRARQNVILELGYFIGAIGRERVCALLKNEIEFPSDYFGVVYHKLDDNGGWKQALARELQSAGFEIDWNKVMR